jgi:hypothetical protein
MVLRPLLGAKPLYLLEEVVVDEGVIDGVGVVDGVPLGVTVGDDEGDELAPILRDAVGVTVGD